MQEALDGFLERDLMLLMDGRYLSLALPENPDFDLPGLPAPGLSVS